MGNASRLAIGMVELNSIARGIETCDYMVKAAQVEKFRLWAYQTLIGAGSRIRIYGVKK